MPFNLHQANTMHGGVLVVTNSGRSPKEDSLPQKPSTWVFDERTGWIDVSDFLKKVIKLNEQIVKKYN